MQVAKNSGSVREPGGRIKSGFALLGSNMGVARDTATEASPALPASNAFLRPMSKDSLAGLAEKPKDTAFLGHSLLHDMQ
jgi:hypothetical protein